MLNLSALPSMPLLDLECNAVTTVIYIFEFFVKMIEIFRNNSLTSLCYLQARLRQVSIIFTKNKDSGVCLPSCQIKQSAQWMNQGSMAVLSDYFSSVFRPKMNPHLIVSPGIACNTFENSNFCCRFCKDHISINKLANWASDDCYSVVHIFYLS